MIGSKLGSYEIREELSIRGMATVHPAYQASIEWGAAIKVISKSIATAEIALQRFQREARLAVRLEHPHIPFEIQAAKQKAESCGISMRRQDLKNGFQPGGVINEVTQGNRPIIYSHDNPGTRGQTQ